MCSASSSDNFHALITANPVINVNDQITRAKRLRFGQEIRRTLSFFSGADQSIAQNILFRNHCQIGRFKPVLQRPYYQMQTTPTDARCIANRQDSGQAFFFDQSSQAFPRAF